MSNAFQRIVNKAWNFAQDGINADPCPVRSGLDSLAADPGERFSMVLTVLAQEIADDLQTALDQFSAIAAELRREG